MAVKYSTSQIVEKFIKVHGDRYDYSKFEYSHKNKVGIIICREHGEFLQCRQHHEKGSGCPHCAGVPAGGFKMKGKDQMLMDINPKMLELYDFSKFEYINNTTNSVVICPIHGEFQKTPKLLIRGQGCPICSGKRKRVKESLQKDVDSVHGKGKYSLENFNYVNNKTKGVITCSIHGPWETRLDNVIFGKNRCPRCAGSISKIQMELEEYIKSLGAEVKSNDKKLISKENSILEIDIVIPTHNLAIELNGIWHHSERVKAKDYHLIKTERCQKLDYQLLHIFEDEWVQKKDIWKSIIRNKLKLNEHKVYARKCIIREVDNLDSNIFLNTNHLQGTAKSSIRLGLYNNNELISLLTLGKSRYDNNIEWEIIRYASKLGYNTVGGFSKLLTYFIKKHNPKSLVTYADRRYSKGDLYKNFGMVERKNDSLNYFYVREHKTERYSRHIFQKHKLKNFLPIYNEELSEWENMKNNGYDRIWDCGNKKFTIHF
jgi:hypothetical protein